MKYQEVHLGFSTADADDLRLSFANGDIQLSFRDWRETPVDATFDEVLAFHWEDASDDFTLRDDTCYEVPNSSWLSQIREAARLPNFQAYAHYLLCFNALGRLDVICRRDVTIER